jgi:hypothetical protein
MLLVSSFGEDLLRSPKSPLGPLIRFDRFITFVAFKDIRTISFEFFVDTEFTNIGEEDSVSVVYRILAETRITSTVHDNLHE